MPSHKLLLLPTPANRKGITIHAMWNEPLVSWQLTNYPYRDTTTPQEQQDQDVIGTNASLLPAGHQCTKQSMSMIPVCAISSCFRRWRLFLGAIHRAMRNTRVASATPTRSTTLALLFSRLVPFAPGGISMADDVPNTRTDRTSK